MHSDSIFLGWSGAKLGKEADVEKIYKDIGAFLSKAVADKQIDGFESVTLQPHGGDLNGFILIRGAGDSLAKIRDSEAWRGIIGRAIHAVDGLGVLEAWVLDDSLTPKK